MAFPIDPTPFKDFLKSGAIYYAGRAKRGLQPLIFMNVRKFCDNPISVDELSQMSFFFFDYMCNNFMLDGKVENWLMVIDCKNVGVTELPI